jgi:hypothetical protein
MRPQVYRPRRERQKIPGEKSAEELFELYSRILHPDAIVELRLTLPELRMLLGEEEPKWKRQMSS